MSRKFLVDGEEYEVDDADVSAFMDDVKAAGKSAAPAGAPQYAPAPRSAGDYFKETAQDTALGAAHGVSFGFDDELLQALAGESTANDYRLAQARARERSPIGYVAGDLGASLLSPVSKLGMAAKVGSAAARLGMGAKGAAAVGAIGGAAIEGGIEGAVRAYGDTEATDDEEVALWKTLAGGATGAGVGGVVGAVGTGVGRIADESKDWLNRKADLNRVAATGVYGSGLKRMMQNHGEDSVRQLGQDIEAAKLHYGNAPGGNWNPLNWVGQDARTYADNAGALRDSAGQRLEAAEDAITNAAAPPTVPLDDLTTQLRDRGAVRSRSWDPAGPREGDFSERFAQRIEDNSNAVLGPNGQPVGRYADWEDAIAQRRYIDDQINWNRLGGGSEAPMEESVRRFVAGDLRAGTKDALELSAQRGTLPQGVVDDWNKANNDYRLSAAVQDPAIARVYQEYGNQKISLPSWMAFSSQENPLRGGLAGMAADFVKYRGASTLAGGERFLANQSENIADFAEAATPGASRLAAVGSARLNRDELSQRARGWANAQATEEIIKRNPQVLGKWGQQLAKAADEDRLNAELLKLSQTDPEFRLQVLPHIEGLTQVP